MWVVGPERNAEGVKAEEVPGGLAVEHLSQGTADLRGAVLESDGTVLQQLVCYMQVSALSREAAGTHPQ